MAVKLNVEKVISKGNIEKVLNNEGSKSSKMILLFEGGLDVKAISELMGVRYNFVYNVVSDYIRKEGLKDSVIKDKKEGVKDKIIELIKEGKSNVEISEELRVNYNMVWKYRNELEKGKIE